MLTAIESKTPIQLLSDEVMSGIYRCDTCGLCLAECPVHRAVGSLHPRSIVRMARLGLMDELIHLPEIWYCLSCRRCEYECPMIVGPASVIAAVRRQACNSRVVSPDTEWRLRSVYDQLHRVRRRVADICFNDEPVPDIAAEWKRLAEACTGDGPGTPKIRQPIAVVPVIDRRASRHYLGFPTSLDCCFTCAECSNACTVSRGRAVFDPMWINRMAAYGLFDEILRSPSIWLCIKCRNCAASCSQGVKGYLVINRLQEMATEGGFVAPALLRRWEEMEKLVYMQFTREVDALLNKSP